LKLVPAQELKVALLMWTWVREHRLAVLFIAGLGVLASFVEGIGIGLFIPLLQDFSGPPAENTSSLVRWLDSLVAVIPDHLRFTYILAAIFSAALIKAALAFSYGALNQKLYSKITHELRSAAVSQLLSAGWLFFQQRKTGSLSYTLATATWQAGDAVGFLLRAIIAVSTISVYLILLVAISWQLTAIVALSTLLISQVGRSMMRRAAVLSRLLRRANAELAQRMFQTLQGMKLIHSFGHEEFERRRFDRTSARVSRILFRLGLLKGTLEPVYEVLIAALLIGILAVGLSRPEILPSILVFILLLYRLQGKIKQLDSLRVSISSSRAAVEDVTSLLSPHGKCYPVSGSSRFNGLARGICFKEVNFSYPSTTVPALRGVTLEVPHGQTTALVGRSGSGKTTLIGLLLRLYEPSSGTILVDGTPLADLDIHSWRERIAVVSQDVYLFDASVRENILYGKLDASNEEVVAAAKLAHAHDFIVQLPEGYETMVGERGVRLSGGQQQRIALARAMIRKPDLLILDEATNALDALSEHLIQEALEVVCRDWTVLVIAHRLSTVEKADQVVVLSKGEITEKGPPADLRAGGQLFAQLHQLQNSSGRDPTAKGAT
jgi:ATP-binding cassette, subfamily B, bacterial MsbA